MCKTFFFFKKKKESTEHNAESFLLFLMAKNIEVKENNVKNIKKKRKTSLWDQVVLLLFEIEDKFPGISDSCCTWNKTCQKYIYLKGLV